MKKLLTFLTLLTLFFTTAGAAEVTDEITVDNTTATSSSYTAFDYTGSSGAEYLGFTAKGNGCIQFNTGNGNRGIVVVTSPGKAKKVKITWYDGTTNGRTVQVWGKNTAYSSSADLYDTSKKGTKIGEIVKGTSTELTITDDYAYLGFLGGGSAMYIEKFEITWETTSGDDPTPTTYSLTLPTGLTGGTVTATGASDLTAIQSGTSMTVTATPSADTYELDWMKANGTEVPNPYTFNISENTTITAAFKEKSTTPTGDYLFYESFDKISGTGGNDGNWSGISSSTNINYANCDNHETGNLWSTAKGTVYTGSQCARMAKASGITTPSISAEENVVYTMSFKAASWSNDGTTLNLSAEGATLYSDAACNTELSQLTMTKGSWTTHTIYVKANSNSTSYKVSFVSGTNIRWFLDEVMVMEPAAGAHTIIVGDITGEGTISADPSIQTSGETVTVTANPGTGYELTALAYNGTAIDITSTPYTFTMPDADVTLTATFSKIEYNILRTITAQNPADEGGSLGNWTGCSTVGEANSATGYPVKATYGSTVGFKAANKQGYKVLAENVTVSAGDSNVPLTIVSSDDSGIVFSFEMPASDVSINAYFTWYVSDLYILGTANDNGWAGNVGVKMDYSSDTEKYTKTVYFAGTEANGDKPADPHGYFNFTERLGNADWSGMGTRYGAKAGDNYDLEANEYTGEMNWWDEHKENAFMVPAGIYTIEVNKSKTQVTVTPLHPTFTFTPAAGSTVYEGQEVTVSSNLYDLLHAINSTITESDVTNEVSLDGNTYSSSVAVTTSATTVTGKATYAFIQPTAEAEYTVNEIPAGVQYELVTSNDDIGEGVEYVIMNKAQGQGYAMSTVQRDNNRGQTALISVIDGKIVPTEDTQIVTLEAATDGGWYLKVGEGYLYTLAGSNYLRTGDNLEATGQYYVANISIGETSHVATIEFATADNEKRYLRRNNSSDIFACYTSGQQEVYLYKKGVITPTVAMPTFNPAAGTYSSAQSVTISCATTGATIYYSTNGTDFQEYTEAITVSESTTLYAKATKDGVTSQVATAEYIIDIPFIGEGDYVKITSTDDLTDGEYLIVYEMEGNPRILGFLFDGNLSTLDQSGNSYAGEDGLGVDIVDYTIESSTRVDAATFTINAAEGEGNYTILSSSGYYIGTTTSGNTLASSQETAYTNTITFDTEGNAVISGGNNTYLRFNIGDDRFRYYGSGQNSIALYKKTTPTTPEMTLADICKYGVTTEGKNEYIIADKLQAVYAYTKGGNSLLWCKDLGNKSIVPTTIHSGQIDFMREPGINYDTEEGVHNGQQGPWDQSNWIVLQFTNPTGPNNIDQMLQAAQDKFIKPGTIKGKLVDNENYILKMDLDQLDLVTQADPDYDEEPYNENVYCPANFLPENLNIHDGIENGDGAQSGNVNYFFMNPKVQEICYITYAQWDDYGYFAVPSSSYFSSGIDGAFQVGWVYQEKPALEPGKIYKFHAVVHRVGKGYGPQNPVSTKDGMPVYENITVLPIDLTADSEVVTSINTVDVTGKAVKSVKYVNVAGMVSDVPFQGVNIVVTEYSDGSRSTSKMLRK